MAYEYINVSRMSLRQYWIMRGVRKWLPRVIGLVV